MTRYEPAEAGAVKLKVSVRGDPGCTVNILVAKVPDPETFRFTVRVIGKRVELLSM